MSSSPSYAIASSPERGRPAATQTRSLLAGRRADAVAVLGLLALVLLFNPGLAFEGRVLGGYDASVYFYPLRAYFAAAVAEGRLPLWNPHLFLGAPFLANPQTAVFYPGTWLFALLDVPRAYALNYLGHLFVAAVGLYALGRWSLGLGPLGSLLGGATFAFSGFMNGQAGHINQISVAAWLPAVALALDVTLRRGSLLAATVLVGGLVLQIMAGHPQEVYMTLVALGLLVLWRQAGRGPRQLLGGLLLLGLAAGLALGLCAVQLLPTAELSRLSIRGGGLSYESAVFEALPWPFLLPALLPGYWSHLPTTEFFGHIGAALFAVAWLGLTFGARVPALLGAVYVALGLVLAVGDATPLYRLLFDWAPGFASFRVPARWLLLSTFGLAILVAVGTDWLARWRGAGLARGSRRALAAAGWPRLVVFGVGVPFGLLLLVVYGEPQSRWLLLVWGLLVGAAGLLALAALAWPRPRAAALAVLLLGGLGEAWLAAAGLEHRNPIPNVAYGQPGEAAAELLRRDGLDGRFRTLSIATPEYIHGETPAIEERYSSLSGLALDNLLVAMKWNDALWPNVPLVYGLNSADGYDGGVLPLGRYVAFTGAMLGPERVRPDGVLASRLDALPEPRWLDLMGVRYVVAGKAKDASRDVFYLDRAISVALGPGERLELGALPLGEFTRLMLLSSYTGPAPAGGEIGRLELQVGDGRVTRIPLRDDRETAAATAEGPGGAALERVEPWSPGDSDQPADWLGEIPFDRQPIAQLAIVNAAPDATLYVRSLNLVDDVRQAAFSITLDERIERTEYFDQKLYDRQDALPRAYVVDNLRVADDAEALRVLADPAFDPRHTVLVAPDGDLREAVDLSPRPGAATEPAGPPGVDPVTFEQAGAERVRLRVRTDAPGYLVLSDTWFPGWQASVDGERVPILRANVLFRAVPVTAGEQVVEFRYEPASFRIGALISAVTLLLGLVLFVGARRLRGRRLRADRRLPYGEPMVGPGHANGAVEPRALDGRVDGPTDGAASDATGLVPHLVALLFAADEPLTVADAARILGARKRQVEQAVELLMNSPPVGLIVQRDGNHLQLATGPASAPYVRRLRGLEDQARLSRASLEVLAVVAYRQPITRAEIEAIRGVGGDRALATLLQRGLVEEVGRKETVGRPVLFGTTLAFLEHLGLRSLADLPPMPGAEQSAAGA